MLALTLGGTLSVSAQVAVTPNPNQEQMLASSDAKVAANERLVCDFWREIIEGGHRELADKYLAESYIQHNPNVPTGRAAFVEFFSGFSKPKAIEPQIRGPLVCAVKGAVFLRVRIPPGNCRSGRKQSEQRWR